jgi:hypothetical protein
VFTYFFWVLLQPFRGNPEYKDVADLPYDSSCLTKIASDQTDIKTLGKIYIKKFKYYPDFNKISPLKRNSSLLILNY